MAGGGGGGGEMRLCAVVSARGMLGLKIQAGPC